MRTLRLQRFTAGIALCATLTGCTSTYDRKEMAASSAAFHPARTELRFAAPDRDTQSLSFSRGTGRFGRSTGGILFLGREALSIADITSYALCSRGLWSWGPSSACMVLPPKTTSSISSA